MFQYPAKFIKEDKFYSLKFIDIDAVTQGKTMEELLLNAQDILSLVIEEDLKRNKEIPTPSKVYGENILYIQPYPEIGISLFLRHLRKESHLTQKQIAEKVNIPYQSYQKIERGLRANITLKTLFKLAKAFEKKLIIDFK
ncbi:MAG: type II toxin-antitoxin system HicB family antitoxin [Candidatus Eremiobacteraeota bacterium]|nr:type II toxin-antitoxin system HicB family antitoxin [Candidatus Eremiobacteraeota bacterium]